MEEIKNRFLSAKEARAIADTTPVVLKRIYKCIKESAEEGRTVAHWGIDDCSSVLVKQLTTALSKAGYSVSVECYEDAHGTDIPAEITIAW